MLCGSTWSNLLVPKAKVTELDATAVSSTDSSILEVSARSHALMDPEGESVDSTPVGMTKTMALMMCSAAKLKQQKLTTRMEKRSQWYLLTFQQVLS